MEYITGIHALNLKCSLDTPGDWHQSAIQWHTPMTKYADETAWLDYGIEINTHVPENPGTHYVANHIRACLDLIFDGNFTILKGMRKDYIVYDKYDVEIFEKVTMLKNHPNWEDIDEFMCGEYFMKWVRFKDLKGM